MQILVFHAYPVENKQIFEVQTDTQTPIFIICLFIQAVIAHEQRVPLLGSRLFCVISRMT